MVEIEINILRISCKNQFDIHRWIKQRKNIWLFLSVLCFGDINIETINE
jgi:hypothetical protein